MKQSLIVNALDNSEVKYQDVCQRCRQSTIYDCDPESGNLYEITLDEKAPERYRVFSWRDQIEVYQAVQPSIIVGFLYLPVHVFIQGKKKNTLSAD